MFALLDKMVIIDVKTIMAMIGVITVLSVMAVLGITVAT